MPKRTTHNEQTIFWGTLKDPNFEVLYKCQRIKSPRELAKFGEVIAKVNDKTTTEKCFYNLMSRDWAPEKIVAVSSRWLAHYGVEVDPRLGTAYHVFSRRFGAYIIKHTSKDHKHSFSACLRLDK